MLKPAPLYILDEIDSALDASHTANIGRMLAKHFQKSQFIVVSLKDGMFNNANVLYKTCFVNGVSSVDRFAKGQPGGPNAHAVRAIQNNVNANDDSDKENNVGDRDEILGGKDLGNKNARPATKKTTKTGKVAKSRRK